MERKVAGYSLSINSNDYIECGFSAGVSAIVSDFIFYPVDTLKTNIQASNQRIRGLKGIRNLGITFRSMYSGLGCVMLGSFPVNLSFFFAYEYMNSILSKTCISNIMISYEDESTSNTTYYNSFLYDRDYSNEY